MFSYNSRSHPLPFMKAVGTIVAPPKAPKAVPDLEEAIEEEEEEEVVAEAKDEDDEADISKDKLIKQPKAKKAGAGKKAAAKKKAVKDK